MKKTETLPHLTKAEFDILRLLWKSGRLSVRELHDQLIEHYQWVYSTTKTMMDRMVKKGLLERQKFHGVFLYQPLLSRPKGFARFIRFFAERVLELDYGAVVALFAHSQALTAEEVAELERLLDEDQRNGPNPPDSN